MKITSRGRMVEEGDKYGRLTVLYKFPNTRLMWFCKCDCGNLTTVYGGQLGRSSNSCGCLYQERIIDAHATNRQNQALKRDAPIRKCNKCEVEKPVSEFYRYSPTRRRFTCKSCTDKRQAAYPKVKRKPEDTRNNNLKRYGLTIVEWDKKFLDQGKQCAICRRSDPVGSWWATDHCHATGKVRGILCGPCNSILGMAKDSVTTLHSAIGYLECHASL